MEVRYPIVESRSYLQQVWRKAELASAEADFYTAQKMIQHLALVYDDDAFHLVLPYQCTLEPQVVTWITNHSERMNHGRPTLRRR